MCATLFARWAVDHPGSPRFRTALADTRRRTDTQRLTPETLGRLRSLFSGRLPAAIRHYRDALASDPGHAVAHYNLGNALRIRGDLDGSHRVGFGAGIYAAPWTCYAY